MWVHPRKSECWRMTSDYKVGMGHISSIELLPPPNYYSKQTFYCTSLKKYWKCIENMMPLSGYRRFKVKEEHSKSLTVHPNFHILTPDTFLESAPFYF